MPGIRTSTIDLRFLFTALLAGMLLVAPCKVRNTLELSLGLEKSEASNKLKTTVSSLSCASYEAVQNNNTVFQELVKPAPFGPSGSVSTQYKVLEANVSNYIPKEHSLSTVVPFYILYRQFQVYA
ncbi:MAG: hypothetical protein GYB37_07675 [Algicola sp.]|nr:hypothetical protein [Algicola sp.]